VTDSSDSDLHRDTVTVTPYPEPGPVTPGSERRRDEPSESGVPVHATGDASECRHVTVTVTVRVAESPGPAHWLAGWDSESVGPGPTRNLMIQAARAGNR
jgi:hypothetical protein